MLLLLGACPEQGCLVYEYMENGSLEDRLLQNNDKPPIPWYERFRIMWEVASALAFLHNNKPKAIIHRDLKPANILLDHNLVSKIGDAGLCTMLNLEPSSLSTLTLYKDTSPVGTLCYIDPEYQRTGLISMKADVYALGMVILQLLTAKPAVGITHVVEDAIKEGRLMKILDRSAGRWPLRETAEIALLGLQCAELRRKDRPDLKSILPALERIKDVAENARDLAAKILIAPPSHFICPILKVFPSRFPSLEFIFVCARVVIDYLSPSLGFWSVDQQLCTQKQLRSYAWKHVTHHAPSCIFSLLFEGSVVCSN